MGKILKPTWHWRCEWCGYEWPIAIDESGNPKKPRRCVSRECTRMHWFTGRIPDSPDVLPVKPIRLKRSSDSVRAWYYGGVHSLDCYCDICRKRFKRGMPPQNPQ